MQTPTTVQVHGKTFQITILETTAVTVDLELTSDDHTANYSDAEAAVAEWLKGHASNWTVDPEMYRTGVGITADGKGAGHAARFFAGANAPVTSTMA